MVQDEDFCNVEPVERELAATADPAIQSNKREPQAPKQSHHAHKIIQPQLLVRNRHAHR